jgi:hypothetical protein
VFIIYTSQQFRILVLFKESVAERIVNDREGKSKGMTSAVRQLYQLTAFQKPVLWENTAPALLPIPQEKRAAKQELLLLSLHSECEAP